MVATVSHTSEPSTRSHISIWSSEHVWEPTLPAAVPVTSLTAIPNALVERTRWTNPLVVQEMSYLLGRKDAARDQYLHMWES